MAKAFWQSDLGKQDEEKILVENNGLLDLDCDYAKTSERVGSGMRESRERDSRSVIDGVYEGDARVARFTRFSIDETESLSEQVKESIEQTRDDVLSRFGEKMSAEQRERLQSIHADEVTKVVSAREYERKMPPGVLGHTDVYGNIEVKESEPDDARHIAVHEGMHLCASRAEYCRDSEKLVTRGIREDRFLVTADGAEILRETKNRGLNEALTEIYTYEELKRQGDSDATLSFLAYQEGKYSVYRMRELLGDDLVGGAYFAGESEKLRREFDSRCGEKGAFDAFAADVDIEVYSQSDYERAMARLRNGSRLKRVWQNCEEVA
jgi:hypothetical protein